MKQTLRSILKYISFNPKNFVRILGAYYPYCLRVGVGINSSTLILFIMYLFYYLVDHFQQLLIFFVHMTSMTIIY